MHTALVIGSTGLVGKALVKQLLEDPDYGAVLALQRRATGISHPKYREQLVDFARPESFADAVRGDVLFSAMGTTRAQAGSVEAQRTVDYGYQLAVATAAARNGVKRYVLVSSAGANERSLFAYPKMKGELERDVQRLGFPSVHLLRPGILAGERDGHRPMEAVGLKVMSALAPVLGSQRPIADAIVAKAMRRVAALPAEGVFLHSAGALFELGA